MDNKLLIFVFDDDKGDIKLLKNVMKQSGVNCEILEASSDDTITRLLNDESLHPDLIFLDIQIPGKGGMEWLCIINEKNTAPVIMLTGAGDEQIAAECIKRGAYDYIPKAQLSNYEMTRTIRNTRERWKLQNERNSLLGIAAHELRNPLATILGYTEILSTYESLAAEKQKEIVAVVHERAAYLQEIINGILDYSRIDKGTVKINFKQEDIVILLKEIISKFRFMSESKKIKLLLMNSVEQCICNFDKVRLEEVFNNLIDNAVKYSYPDSEVYISIQKDGNSVVVEITDNGQGIKVDELKFLFELFSNVKISSRPTGGEQSTGLGLAICKKIIDLHNGSISVISTLGKGSTFIVKLPAS